MSTDIKAGGAYIEVFAKDQLQPGLVAARKRLTNFASSVAAIGGVLSAASGSMFAPLAAGVMKFTSIGSELADINARTGASAGMLSGLGYAAKLAGASLQDVQGGFKGLAKLAGNVEAGSKSAAKVLDHLGISAAQFLAATPDDRMKLVADGLSRIKDPGMQSYLALKALGGAGMQLLPILQQGSAGLSAMSAEAARFGLIFTDEEVARADRLGDAIDVVKNQIGAMFFQIGDALSPVLQPVLDGIKEVLGVVVRVIDQNPVLVTGLAAVAGVLGIVGGAFLAVSTVGFALAGVMMGINAVVSIAMGIWAAYGAVKTAVAAINAILVPLFTAEGAAALFASIQTFLFSVAASAATVAGAALAAVLGFIATPLGLIALFALLAFTGLAALVVVIVQCTDAVAYLNVMGSMAFTSLLATFKQTMGGITDALFAGNLALAGEVAMAGLNVVWQKGLLALQTFWSGFKATLKSSFVGLFDGLYQQLEVLRQRVTDTINRLRAQAGLAPVQDATGLAGTLKSGHAGTTAWLAGIELARQKEVGEAMKNVAKAQKELDRVTGQAAKEKVAAEDKFKLKANPAALGIPDIKKINPAEKPGGQSLGTFSGAVAHMLDRSGSIDAAERTADAAEATVEKLDEIEDELSAIRDRGGLAFV